MRIVQVASEAAPFAKTGGLADVAGALPKALVHLGHEPILIMPLYRSARHAAPAMTEVGEITVPVGAKNIQSRLWRTEMPQTGSPVIFIEQDAYFDRSGLYGDNGNSYSDNCERFTFLSRGAIEAARALRFEADVFHLHDWQTALVAPYLRLLYAGDPLVGRAAALLTIHNIAHQGVFWSIDMNLIGLDWRHFNWQEFEYWGKLCLLKGGIVYADVVNTVSPTYAREIERLEYGWGLDGVLRDRDNVLHGVVNGIDEAVWNPATDKHLAACYSAEDLAGKATCKRSLQRQVGLPQRKVPLAGIVSRFAEQKGLDLVANALPGVFEREALQCVVLGDGDADIRAMLEAVARRFPDRLKVLSGQDEKLAHRIVSGSDMFLTPSRFEPCGLTQLYGLKYGSVPVVRETGGLIDTVADCTPDSLAAGRATGFKFREPTPAALAQCLLRAIELYRDPKSWLRLMQIGMAQDWSWEASAKRYLELYDEARTLRGHV